MIRFGGTMTLNGLIMYVANNFDKVLLGRYWGADAIGLYYSASQFIRIPTDNLYMPQSAMWRFQRCRDCR